MYAFTTIAGCEIRYEGTAELNYIPHISAVVPCKFNFSVRKSWMLKLTMRKLRFPKGSKNLT